MVIEVGKYYRTRGGSKAYVGARLPANPFDDGDERYIGYIEGGKGYFIWDPDGSANLYGEGDKDLIEPWVEKERVKVWIWWHYDGSFSITDRNFDKYLTDRKLYAVKDVEFSIGEGLPDFHPGAQSEFSPAKSPVYPGR